MPSHLPQLSSESPKLNERMRWSENFAMALWGASDEHAPAIVERDGETTYAQLRTHAREVAALLTRLEVTPADRVAILVPRGASAAGAFFGVLTAGAVAVIVNDALRPRQIEHIVRHSGASVLLASDAVLARAGRPLDVRARIESIDLLRGPRASQDPVSRISTDPAQIIYTSGSTGLPKGVVISHGNLWTGVASVVEYLGITSADRIASLLPFSFDYGLNQLLCAVTTGATLVVERSSVPARIVATLRGHEVSVLPCVPPLWLQLLAQRSFTDATIPSLRAMTNTGGRLPTDAVRTLRRTQPHADTVLMYGLTEAFRSTFLSPEKADDKPDSIGAAIPGAEILVVDGASEACAIGETGQLVHRGPTVALGYWNDREATERVYRPNPIRSPETPDAERVVFSGDLVRRDEDGDHFFVGRRDSLIKTLGYRVSPDEVVDALYASAQVVEAIVTSEPDDARGAAIVAHVVMRPDGSLDALADFCRRELPTYMQPSRFDVRPSLERTHSGKYDIEATRSQRDNG